MSLFDGVVAAWKLSDLTDATGRGNTLTNNNSATFNTGKIGNAAYFTGSSSQYLSRSSNADLQAGDIDFTLGCWFYIPNANSNQDAVLVAKRSEVAGGSDYALYYEGSIDQ